MKAAQIYLQPKSANNPKANNLQRLLRFVYRSQDVSQQQKNYLNLYRVNSFLFVLLQANKTIISESVNKNVQCLSTNNEAIKFISQLDGSQIKNAIMKNMCNYVEELKKQRKLLKQSISESSSFLSLIKQFTPQEKGRLTNSYLSQLMQDVKNSLKTQYKNKAIYGLMNFKWSTEFIRTFILAFNQHQSDLVQLQKSVQQLGLQIDNLTNQNSTVLNYDEMSTPQLLEHISNKVIAQLILKQFNKLNNELISKEKQIEGLQAQIKESAQVIKEQIAMLINKEQQRLNLEEKQIQSQLQLKNLNKKCETIQKELQRLNQQLENIKQQPLGYYLNPICQKQKIQQKFFVEIVQLQSDLLMEKEQVQNLVNICLEEIKLSPEFFHELRASKYTIYRFDCGIVKLMKKISAFDKINLQDHLNIRQESLRSQSSPQMYKSTISTYSEVDTEGKMRSERQIMQFQIVQQECKHQ